MAEENSKLGFYCDIEDVCRSCVMCNIPFECCYNEFQRTKRPCNFRKCFFTEYCPHANLKSFKAKESRTIDLSEHPTTGVFKSPATNLPSSFIPEVMPSRRDRERAMAVIKDVDVPGVAISMQNFFRGTRGNSLLSEARRLGLHEFLNYGGEIVLTTDVNDSLCDKFVENPDYFVTVVKKLRPDYLTTFDTYTYSNVPACVARLKINEVLSSMDKLLNLDCRIIGLALGATPIQVKDYTQELITMGCHLVAHPVYEFRKGKYPDTYSIRWRARLSRNLKARVLLLSCSPGVTARMKVYADYYSCWSWFSSVRSKGDKAYEERRARLSKAIELAKKYSQQTFL